MENSEFIIKNEILVSDKDGEYEVEPSLLKPMKINLYNKGFVELISNSGYDFTPVERQRISYNNYKNKTYKKDLKLLNKLMKEGHFTPFEHISLTFRIKVPIFVQRHIVKYRLSTINEISGRYTDDNKNEFYSGEIRFKKGNKNPVNGEDEFKQIDIIRETYNVIEKNYNKLIDLGVQKEFQRIIQPVGQYTTFYWTLNLREFFHVCNQRLTKHAQNETQLLVLQMFNILRQIYPLNMKQFYDNLQNEDNKKNLDLLEIS